MVLLSLLIAQSAGAASPENGLATLDFREVVKHSKDKVFPAVVYVKCVRQSHEMGEKKSHQVSGSGVLISNKGEVLTNWHVIDKAIEVRCLLFTGQPFYGKVIGKDKDLDLALVQLKLDKNTGKLPFATLGDSDKLSEGDFVMAMGAPFGLTRSVSIGIISCTSRFLEGISQYSLWLQTDASINPGNSGGPLINTDGEVIGINTRGISYGGDMGFAVPSSTIKEILPRLRENSDVEWSWTGIEIQAIRDFNRNMYFDGKRGVIVSGTEKGSPGRRAGIQDRDRIIEINGKPVDGITEESLPAIRRTIGLLPIDKPSGFKLIRGGTEVVLDVTPRKKGKVEGDELDCPRWDMTVKAINQFDNPQLYFHRKEGVFIFGLKHPGNASNARFSSGDIILKIDGKDVKTLDDVKGIHKAAIENVASRPRIMFTILRNGMMRQAVLDFSTDHNRE